MYSRHRFPAEIISYCVWLYYTFPLSYRDIEKMMLYRGVEVTYESIREWCQKFGQQYTNQLRCKRPYIADIALRKYVRTIFKSGIDTITKAIKFIPSLPHPVLEHKPPMFNLVGSVAKTLEGQKNSVLEVQIMQRLQKFGQ
jgi:hypothetical protein